VRNAPEPVKARSDVKQSGVHAAECRLARLSKWTQRLSVLHGVPPCELGSRMRTPPAISLIVYLYVLSVE